MELGVNTSYGIQPLDNTAYLKVADSIGEKPTLTPADKEKILLAILGLILSLKGDLSEEIIQGLSDEELRTYLLEIQRPVFDWLLTLSVTRNLLLEEFRKKKKEEEEKKKREVAKAELRKGTKFTLRELNDLANAAGLDLTFSHGNTRVSVRLDGRNLAFQKQGSEYIKQSIKENVMKAIKSSAEAKYYIVDMFDDSTVAGSLTEPLSGDELKKKLQEKFGDWFDNTDFTTASTPEEAINWWLEGDTGDYRIYTDEEVRSGQLLNDLGYEDPEDAEDLKNELVALGRDWNTIFSSKGGNMGNSAINSARGEVSDPTRKLVLEILKQVPALVKTPNREQEIKKEPYGPDHVCYFYSEEGPRKGSFVTVEFHVDPSDLYTDVYILTRASFAAGKDGDEARQDEREITLDKFTIEDLEDYSLAEVDRIDQAVLKGFEGAQAFDEKRKLASSRKERALAFVQSKKQRLSSDKRAIKSDASWEKYVQEIMDEEGLTRQEAEEEAARRQAYC